MLLINNYITPWLGKTSRLLASCVFEHFKKHGVDMTIEQFIMLKVLNDQDGQIQNDLAYITHRDKTSLTRLINTLERKKYVKRICSKCDKRKKRIYLTPSGKDKFISMLPIMQLFFEKVQNGLTDEEVNFMISTFKKIQTNIEQQSN